MQFVSIRREKNERVVRPVYRKGYDPDVINVGGVLRTLTKNVWILVLTTAACIFLAWHYAFNIATPLYLAQATILMETQQQNIVNLEGTTASPSGSQTALNTEVGILRSRELMGQVVEQLNLTEDPEFNPLIGLDTDKMTDEQMKAVRARLHDIAVSTLLLGTEVRNLPLTYIFEVQATTKGSAKSADIANSIADAYLAQQVNAKSAATKQALAWMSVRVAQLQTQLEEADRRLEERRFNSSQSRSEDRIRLEQLTSDAEAIRELYQYFLTRLKETTVQEGLHRPDSRVLSRAIVPLGVFSPRPLPLLLIGALAGLSLGLMIVFVRETLSRGVRSSAELESVTGYSVVGEIPIVSRLKGLSPPNDPIHAEAINDLRATLLLSRRAGAPRIVAICSSVPGDGKTSLTLALAQNLSRNNKRILVVDCDMRDRKLTQLVKGGAQKPGLTEVLTQRVALDEVVFPLQAFKADVLCCGSGVQNPLDLLSSAEFKSALDQLCGVYDTVIIDTPPLLAVPDALPVAKLAELSLFLVRWRKTTKSNILQGLEMLERVEVRPTGLIMSRIKRNLLSRSSYQDYLAAGLPPSAVKNAKEAAVTDR